MKQASAKTFDVACLAADRINEVFGPIWKVNKPAERALEVDCDLIDKFALEHGGKKIYASVDETSMTFSIAVSCSEFILEDTSDAIYNVIRHAVELKVNRSDDGVDIVFVLPGIWDRAF